MSGKCGGLMRTLGTQEGSNLSPRSPGAACRTRAERLLKAGPRSWRLPK